MLVGNPNVGKSMLFGLLTGRYATVSNYPGTTVEVTRGRQRQTGEAVIDTPGTNSLLPNSEDEKVTRDILLAELRRGDPRVMLVFDAKNPQRGLNLALQLAELEAPMAIVANMLDEATTRGIRLDLERIGELFGVEVLGTVATQRQGTGPIVAGRVAFRPSTARVRYDEAIEAAIQRIGALLPADLRGRRGIAVAILADAEPDLIALAGEHADEVAAIRADLAHRYPESLRFAINRGRANATRRIVEEVTHRTGPATRGWAARFGDLAMHPAWGLAVAALVLFLVYEFVGVLGAGTSVDFLEGLFENYLTPWSDAAIRLLAPEPLETFLAGPPGTAPGTGPGLLVGEYGVISMALSYSVAIVLPIVGYFFIAFALMEDSGYLPRLAVVLNRVFRLMGLNGKAVLPMILGLGCDTMATMTARILPSRKERVLVTLLLALAVPCSAQLGVILGMLSALSTWASLTWLGSVLLVILLVGWLGSKVLPGQAADFILEVPPIRRPALGNVLVKTVARVEWYLREAVPLFILGTFILWLLDRVQVLGGIRDFAAPVVQTALGLPAEATDAFIIGFLRRDYGAAGLYALFHDALAQPVVPVEAQIQVIVSMVTITLFVPCIANTFMIIKERGAATAAWMLAFIFPFAFLVGAALNFGLRAVLL